eukprot:EST44036.1 Hypothetical protein SS50377_16346 [Spironucleus salmonicida]
MNNIIKSQDNELRIQATTTYFQYLDQFPDEYLVNMIKLFELGDDDVIAFCCTIIRKNLLIKSGDSLFDRCQNKDITQQFLIIILQLLSNNRSFSKILADLCGEIAVNFIRCNQNINLLLQYIDQALTTSKISDVSIIIWSLTNSKWRYTKSFILQYLTVLCESLDPTINSYAFLGISNILMSAQYANDDEDCVDYDLQQQFIAGLFQILQKISNFAFSNRNAFKQTIECFVEMIECIPELFSDYIDQIFEFITLILTQSNDDQQLFLIGINLCSSVISQSDTLFQEEKYFEYSQKLLITIIYPSLNNISEDDMDNIEKYQKIDVNSSYQTISDSIFSMYLGQIQEIALPTINNYIQLHKNDVKFRISIIEIIKQLFYTEQLDSDQELYANILVEFLSSMNTQIEAYWILYSFNSIIVSTENNQQINKIIFNVLTLVIENIIQCDQYVQITFLTLLNNILQSNSTITEDKLVFIKTIIQHFSQNQNLQIKYSILKIITLLIDQSLLDKDQIHIYLDYYIKEYFTFNSQIFSLAQNQDFIQYFGQVIESLSLFLCQFNSTQTEIFINSIFTLLAQERIDELHSIIDSLIISITQLLTKFASQFSQTQVDISFIQFFNTLNTPLFEQEKNTFDENQKCNSYILKQQKLVFTAIQYMFVENPLMSSQHVTQTLKLINKFNYIKQYQFINVASCYASMLIATNDNQIVDGVINIFNQALDIKTRRTVNELEPILSSFQIIITGTSQLESKEIYLQSILQWTFNLIQMVNKSFNKYMSYSSYGIESEICQEQLSMLYQGQIRLQTLFIDISHTIEVSTYISNFMQQDGDLQNQSFLGVFCYILLQLNCNVQNYLINVQIQVNSQIPNEYIYIFYTQLILQKQLVIQSDEFDQLLQKYTQYQSQNLGALVLLVTYTSQINHLSGQIAKTLAQVCKPDKLLFQVLYFIVLIYQPSDDNIICLLIHTYYANEIQQLVKDNLDVITFMQPFVLQHSQVYQQYLLTNSNK